MSLKGVGGEKTKRCRPHRLPRARILNTGEHTGFPTLCAGLGLSEPLRPPTGARCPGLACPPAFPLLASLLPAGSPAPLPFHFGNGVGSLPAHRLGPEPWEGWGPSAGLQGQTHSVRMHRRGVGCCRLLRHIDTTEEGLVNAAPTPSSPM